MLAGESKDMRSFCQTMKSLTVHIYEERYKDKIFSACVKSVLLHGCETWLVANKLRRKIQTFINKCLKYIIKNLVAWNHFT
jgi:hypothetical protein